GGAPVSHDASEDEIDPIAKLGEGIADREIVVISTGDWNQIIAQRFQSAWKRPRKALRRSAPHLEKMTSIAEQPAATDALPVTGWRSDIAELRDLGEQRGEVDSRIDRQRQ